MIPGCCQRKRHKRGYDICVNDEETPKVIHDQDDLSEEDFTLRTVESLEVDAMLSKLSPIKGAKTPSNNNTSAKVVTSTPRKKKTVKKVERLFNPQILFTLTRIYLGSHRMQERDLTQPKM